MQTIVILDSIKDWPFAGIDIPLVTAQDYLTNIAYQKSGSIRALNLCRSHAYQRLGYYVSMVATARGHKPKPSQLCMEDLKSSSFIRMVSNEMDEVVQKSLQDVDGESFVLRVYFGQTPQKSFAKLASSLVQQFPAPLLKVRFSRLKDKWAVVNAFPVPINRVPDEDLDFASEQAKRYLMSGKMLKRSKQKAYRYDLALLVNPDDPHPPSNRGALDNFLKSAERQGFAAEILGANDLGRIAEFDALFIRETTQINHHTYQFARRAAAHGIVVIDDPISILRCCNKIYLAELLNKHSLPMPKTAIISSEVASNQKNHPNFPFVLKRPDGCFSNAVALVRDEEEFHRTAETFFAASDLIIAQEFMASDFDWRIGVLDNKLLYACKYYMVKDHWQIVRKKQEGEGIEEGESEAVPFSKVPPKVKALALKVSSLIGDGLYGIDIKEKNGEFFVIEINDNPSIDAGFEDELLGEYIYDEIISCFKNRVESLGQPSKT